MTDPPACGKLAPVNDVNTVMYSLDPTQFISFHEYGKN